VARRYEANVVTHSHVILDEDLGSSVEYAASIEVAAVSDPQLRAADETKPGIEVA
jgi:hypothetical protein